MRVVQDMAEVARLLGWRQRPGEPLVELAGLIRETVALVHMDDRRGAPVTIVTLEECLIAGDVQRLRTALRRLWRDASASASPGTVIRVGLSGANGTVHLFLQQSLAGAGGETDPKALPVLLGLDAAETIVAQFPGGVNLAVDWHDFRSVLTLSVPAKRPPLVDPPRRTVLVVDDNRSFLDVFLDLLQRDGFDPRGVTSLEEARQAAVSIQPPLAVLCDLTLSDGAGWELLPYLRTLPGWERVPVAALTGWDDYDGTDLTQQGFDAVMLKPVKRHTWLEWLRQIESR
jgi:CheY-like chemotaxis protein